ncbi:multidrug effflux MFS transporter [Bremerella sp. JC817]|uniref:multidrug effflux MFS transporter n=1 Tax=Bremerella sp. JC817 TaxID=3231756 RepID=UPI00345AA4DC
MQSSSPTETPPQLSPWLIAPVLGVLGALGPMSIDLYLPGMPQIVESLRIDEGTGQLSLMTFLGGLMLGQLFYGPTSDRLGRKPMIFVGLVLFTIASLGCAFVQTGEQLLLLRFIQGLGGAIGRVVGMAVVRDLYRGKTAAMLVAMMMLVLGLAPIVAPLIGSAILLVAPWQWLFVFLTFFGLACIVMVAVALPETRLEAQRTSSHPLVAIRNYGGLLLSRQYMPYVAALSLAQAGFYAYLTGSSFIFINLYGLSPTMYSVLFATNAVGLLIGAQIAPRLIGRFQAENIVRSGLVAYTMAAMLLVTLQLTGALNVVLLSVLLFMIIVSLAFVMPIAAVLALESQGKIAGTAAAMLGACQFGFGTVAALVIGLTANGTAMPMVMVIGLSSLAAISIAFLTFPGTEETCLQEEAA